MVLFKVLLTVLTVYAALWAAYVLVLPVAAALRRSSVKAQVDSSAELWPNIAVIVPAHNMESCIERCIASLQACNYANANLDIIVVSDHSTDATAECAVRTGATVLIREDGPRGKTYTIAWAIDALSGAGVLPDLYVIVDATARVDPAFLKSLAARWMQGEDIVISRAIVDTENQQWFAQCLGLTLAHRNLQNWARERLGLSAFISGRGMAYSRRYIERFGWSLALPTSIILGAHPTEDWRHGVRIVEQGLRAAFADDARVFTPLRDSLSAATQQGIRWERGRIGNAFTHGSRLLLCGLQQRSTLKIMAALDAIQPPVAILAGLCAAIAVMSVLVATATVHVFYGLGPLFLVCCYGLAVVEQGRRHEGIKARTILWAPVYIAWRVVSFGLALGTSGRQSTEGRAKD